MAVKAALYFTDACKFCNELNSAENKFMLRMTLVTEQLLTGDAAY